MVDFIKKVQKKAGSDLEAGETILDARVVAPAGQAMRQAIAGGAFQYGAAARIVAQRHAAAGDRRHDEAMDAQGGLAAGFPTAKCFFTLTDRRVLVHSFSAMTGSPKELLATYPLTEFAGMEAQQGKLISKLTLIMADGTTVPLDVFKGGGDPQDLIDAFNSTVEAAH